MMRKGSLSLSYLPNTSQLLAYLGVSCLTSEKLSEESMTGLKWWWNDLKISSLDSRTRIWMYLFYFFFLGEAGEAGGESYFPRGSSREMQATTRQGAHAWSFVASAVPANAHRHIYMTWVAPSATGTRRAVPVQPASRPAHAWWSINPPILPTGSELTSLNCIALQCRGISATWC